MAARVRRAASWRRHRRTPPVRLPEPCLTHDYTERVVAFDITGAPDVPPQYLCADPAAVPPMRPTRVRATYRSRPGAPWAREIVNVRGLYVPAAPYTHQAPAPLPAGQRP
ncbi:hypothetical protein ACIQVO_36230 [Streptomyces sp. NPDC101062]|uniref:hypothetical protein n=1 Tax=unclassified Streptomyces TaxID=2593676 RepID=UPI0037FFA0F0